MQYSELFVGYGPAREVRPPHPEGSGHVWSFLECRAYVGQLHRLFGPPPNGAKLFIRTHEDCARHWWYTVVCRFDNKGRDAATEYVIRAQDRIPERWDHQARAELGLDAPHPAPAASGGHAKDGTPASAPAVEPNAKSAEKPNGKSNDKPNDKPLKRPVRHKPAPKAAKPAKTRVAKKSATKPTPAVGTKPAQPAKVAPAAAAGKGVSRVA